MDVEKFRADLRQRAAALPSMGGAEVGPLLEQLAAQVPCARPIVEVGCWLGAGTAHLAIGAQRSGSLMYVYDRWRASAAEVEKAQRYGIELREGEDTLPRVTAALVPFQARITYRQGDLRKALWPGGEIGLYVDDASKDAALWKRASRMFLARVPVGGVAVLMDYHFQSPGRGPLAQVRYMTDRAAMWRLEHDRPGGTTAAVFRRYA